MEDKMRNLLVGERVKITAIKESDKPFLEEWFNDLDFMRHYDMVAGIPKDISDINEMLDGFKGSSDRYIFAIREKSTEKLIGIAGFDEIIWSNSTAVVFIGVGQKEFRGKGFGKEAFKLLLDFGFNEMNFYKIQLTVLQYNLPAIKLYESSGFVKEGTYREYIFKDGKRHDLYLYGLLRREFEVIH
jgi:RimJ/RimL family protein N-acetyltransferase